MLKKPRGVEIIEAMPYNEFYHKVTSGIAHREEIAELIFHFAENVSPEVKEGARNALAEIGIPLSLTESDDDLDYITATIGRRMVER